MLLRCSNAYRWWCCALSAHATDHPHALPDFTHDAAMEGTCAAWAVETVVNGDATCIADMVGKTHENGWVVDEEMERHLEPLVQMVQDRQGVCAEVHRSVEMAKSVTLAGTCDLESHIGDTLYIDDLKYGYEIVDPFENKQLLCYAYLALSRLKTEQLPKRVSLGIYQPRAIHPDGIYRRWEMDVWEIEPYFDELARVVGRIDYRVSSPGRQCMHCGLAASCQALTETVYRMFETVQDRSTFRPSGRQLSDELTMLGEMKRLFEARAKAVEAEAEIRIRNQEFVPGWGLVDKTGKRAFKHGPDTVHALTGVDPYEKKVVTPAELERRGANPDMVKALTYTPTVGRKLAPVTKNAISKMFK